MSDSTTTAGTAPGAAAARRTGRTEETADAGGAGTRLTLGGRSVRCTSPAEARLLWNEMSSEGFYRRAAARLRPGDVVVDVGANVGLASLAFAEAQPEARIIALEPVPELFSCLEENLAAHVRNGTAVRAAVCDAPGVRTLQYYPEAPGNSGLYADREADDEVTRTYLRNGGMDEESIELLVEDLHEGRPVEVDAVTVSQVLDRHGIAEVALLKVDVERAELDVLRGVGDGDWSRIRNVVAEVHDDEGRLDAVRALLHDRGFVSRVRQDPGLKGTRLYEVDALAG